MNKTQEEIEHFQIHGPEYLLTDEVDLVQVWDEYEKEDNTAICGIGSFDVKEIIAGNTFLYKYAGVERRIFGGSQKVIDIGAGYDILQKFMPYADYYPIDIKQRTAQTIVVKDEKLPFQDNFADAVYTLNMFQHINPERRLRYVQEAKRVLRPNGLLFIGARIDCPHRAPSTLNYNNIEYAHTGKYAVPFISFKEIGEWVKQGFGIIDLKFTFLPGLDTILLYNDYRD